MSIAIIGIGKWGKNLLRDFSKICHVSYCCSKGNVDNVQWLQKNYPKIKHTTNLSDIFDNPDITAVVIATPINTHFNLVSHSLVAGKHVFVEKPLSMTVKEGKKLINIAKEKKLFLFVGHIFLFHPIFLKIKKLIINEKIENIIISWEKFGTFNDDILLNLGSHQLSVVIQLLGQPKKISILENFQINNISHYTFLKSIHKNNQICLFEINRFSTRKNWTMTIFCQNSVYLWNNEDLLKIDKNYSLTKIHYKKNSPLELECKFFYDSIKNNKIQYENAINALDIIETIRKIS